MKLSHFATFVFVVSTLASQVHSCTPEDCPQETHACDQARRNHDNGKPYTSCELRCETHEDCVGQDLPPGEGGFFYCKISNHTTNTGVCETCSYCETAIESLNDAIDGTCPRSCLDDFTFGTTVLQGCLAHDDCKPDVSITLGQRNDYFCSIDYAATNGSGIAAANQQCVHCAFCGNEIDTADLTDPDVFVCQGRHPFDGRIPDKCRSECESDNDCPDLNGLRGLEPQYCKEIDIGPGNTRVYKQCRPCHECRYGEAHCHERCVARQTVAERQAQ